MRNFAFAGALFSGLGVMFGAFGAHVLKQNLSADNLQVFITGTNYQMLHGLALLLLSALEGKLNCSHRATVTGWLFLFGIVFFSGSLYVLSMTGIKAMGMVAPVGGICLIAGWLTLAINIWQAKKSEI